jgi:hypothetical protein
MQEAEMKEVVQEIKELHEEIEERMNSYSNNPLPLPPLAMPHHCIGRKKKTR